MKKYSLVALLLATLLTGCDNHISDEDRIFMKEAGSAGLMEVQMAQLALAKASDKKTIEFARTMVKNIQSLTKNLCNFLKGYMKIYLLK